MLVELPAVAAHVLEGTSATDAGPFGEAPRTSFDLSSRPSVRSPEARSALASAGVAACLVGLAGTDAGIVWIVAGVWTVRSMASAPLGIAWGIACLGAGMRWGTLSLGDVAVATRLGGPTVATGPLLVRAGMIAALVAALAGEMHSGGFATATWGERAAAAGAVVVLVPLFVVRGPGDPRTMALTWLGSAAALTCVVVVLRPLARRMPAWVPSAVAVTGVILAASAG
jgi:hypothetical protein